MNVSKLLAVSFFIIVLNPIYGQVSDKPAVMGLGKQCFSIGNKLYDDNLDDSVNFERDWIVQMSNKRSFERYAKIKNGKLEVLTPAGCTVWFNKKITGPVCITYKVVVSDHRNTGNIISTRDINNFWMAGEIGNIDNILNGAAYNGKFKTYHTMQGYYVSMGGGNNTTNRMRIYPRVKNNDKCEHLALNHHDGNPDLKIIAGKEYKIQLVAFYDLIQFIVNDELVYELKYGMETTATTDNENYYPKAYSADNFPVYKEGYFGFRMTRTLHKYYDFKVFKLKKL